MASIMQTIFKIISGNIKYCLEIPDKNTTYYIDTDATISGDKIIFTDAIDGQKYKVSFTDAEMGNLKTFGDNTIPTAQSLNEFLSSNNTTFFQTYSADHKLNNDEFNEKVAKVRAYSEFFNDEYTHTVKRMCTELRYRDLDFLKIIGFKEAVCLDSVDARQSNEIKRLYKDLIHKKLNESIETIKESIVEMDDPEFTDEAQIIIDDLTTNVIEYANQTKNLTVDSLEHHWPTLLNPSPFVIAG